MTLNSLGSSSSEPRLDAERPWPGLFSFAEVDRDFFFGREEEVEELLELVRNHRLTVLYGASGLGKSSLLRAGLFPRLREHDYLPVLLRFDYSLGSSSPSAQLKSALRDAIEHTRTDAPPSSTTESMWEYLHRRDVEFWSPRHGLLTPVFVFDQFEELFTKPPRDIAGDTLRTAVVDMLADLSEGRVPRDLKSAIERNPPLTEHFAFREHRYRLLITIREDYLADLDDLASAMLSLNRSRMRLTHMRGARAVAAVAAAAKRAQLVPPAMAFEIVRFVGTSTAATGPDVSIAHLPIEPALLSVMCFELNEERIRDGRSQIEADQLTKSDAILERFYANAVAGAPESLLTFLEDHLITPEGIREVVAFERFLRVPDVSENDIKRLVDGRVLREEYREGRRRVELTHDLLARVVRSSRERRQQFERSREVSAADEPERTSDLRQLAALLTGLRALGTGRVLDEVLALVVDSAIELSGTERGFIMLSNGRGDLEVKVGRLRGQSTLPAPVRAISFKIAEDVFATGHRRVIADLFDGDLADIHIDVVALGIRQVVCVPLRVVRYVKRADAANDSEIIGVLYLDSREKGAWMSTSSGAALEAMATEASVAIESARLYHETSEKARIEQERQIAANIQRSLLPPGNETGSFYDACATSLPSHDVGGDFFGFWPTRSRHFSFGIGDVSGKGAAAATLTARIRGALDVCAEERAPSGVIAAINRSLTRHAAQSRYATILQATLTAAGRLTYCNAGHNPALLLRAQSIVRLEAGGMPVGLFDNAPYEDAVVQLSAGDLLVLFTDGVAEALSAEGQEFGEERIIQAVRAANGARPDVVLKSLIDSVHAFIKGAPQHDDVTAMVIRYQPSSTKRQ